MSLLGARNSHADDVVECLFPIDGSGLIGVLRCGIDASTNKDGNVFTVAAVAFDMGRAKRANKKWDVALKGRVFHMTDLNAREGDFKGIEDKEVKDLMIQTVGAVRDYSAFVVAVSCDLEEVRPYLPATSSKDITSPEMLAAFRSAYGVMVHLCMTAVGHFAGGGREVSYTLERGDEGQGGLIRYLDFIENSSIPEQMCDLYSFRRKSVGGKDEIEGIFHSADLIAWEWGRQVARNAKGLPKRRSFEIIEKRTKNYFRHFGSGEMTAFLETFQLILDATSQEDVQRAITYWRAARPLS